jgi:hypothetical protein
MIEIQRFTHEEALRRTFKDDPSTVGQLLTADDNCTLHATFTYKYDVPVKYAKQILKDYINEQIFHTR